MKAAEERRYAASFTASAPIRPNASGVSSLCYFGFAMSQGYFRAAFACVLILSAPTLAAAQGGPPGKAESWTFSAGVAPFFAPIYSGADDYGLSLYPDLRVAYGDRFFASVPEGIGYRVINTRYLKAGPIARIRFGRESGTGGSPFLIAGETDDLDGFSDVSAAGEFGGFVEFGGRYFSTRAELRRGVGGHEGLVADVSASYSFRSGSTGFSMGPRATLAGEDFIGVYYGVDQSAASASGLAAYDPGGGVVSYGAGATLIRPLTDRLSLAVIAGYDRIAGDAARSPLVRARGDADQISLIVAFSWRFGVAPSR